MVVVFWVPNPPDVHLDSCQFVFTWQQAAQEGALCGFTNCILKLVLRKCPKPVKCLIQRELLTIGVVQQVPVTEPCPHHLQLILHH